jgi:GT2 family glycosyltransferase
MGAVHFPVREGLVVSVVSHGHGAAVRELLQDLARLSPGVVTRVVLTLNLPGEPAPADPTDRWPFVLQVRRNARPLGFGANHNRALAGAQEPWVCVLNPDVRLADDPFAGLIAQAGGAGVGAAYPLQRDARGRLQDSERALPTPMALWRRRVLGRSEPRTDWVYAACLVLPAPVWRQLGGFDERYYMYCEDVDLSLRLRLAGLRLVRAPVTVVHAGQRASHRSLRHLAWHLRSLLRLWCSPTFRAAGRLAPAPLAPLAHEGRP